MSKWKKNLIKISMVLIMLLSLMGMVLSTTKTVSAATSIGEIYNNIMLNMMKKCYAPLSMSTEIDLMEYRGSDAEASFQNYVLNGAAGGQQIYVPTGIENGLQARNDGSTLRVACSQLFLADGNTFTCIYNRFGKSLPNPSSDSVGEELGNIGYTISESGNTNQICLVGKYHRKTISESIEAGKVCWDINHVTDGDMDSFATAVTTTPGNGTSITFDAIHNTTPGANNAILGYSVNFKDPNGKSCLATGYIDSVNDIEASDGGTCTTGFLGGTVDDYTVTLEIDRLIGIGEQYGTRKIQDFGNAYYTARKFFGGDENLYEFSAEEQYTLYYAYLKDIYKITESDGECKTRQEVAALGGPVPGDGRYYVYENGLYYKRGVQDSSKNLRVSVFGSDKNFLTGYYDFEGVVQNIYNLNLPQEGTCDDGGGGGSGGVNDPGMNKPGDGKLVDGDGVDCNQLNDIGAMQWVLCPVMNNEQHTASWIDNQTQEWLTIKTDVYATDAIHDTWKNIRNIANIVMIIFFLVIIFSQVTGYGIDN